jgi:hypothetical protein
MQLFKELWPYVAAIVTVWITIVTMLFKHNKADQLTRQLLARLPLWMRLENFGERSGVPNELAAVHAGDCWFSQHLIISNGEHNRAVFQSVEQYVTAYSLPLRSGPSFASAALTGLLLFVFVLVVSPVAPDHPAASASSLSQPGTSVQPQASSQNLVGAGGNAQDQSLTSLTIGAALFLVLSVGLYGALFLLFHYWYVLPNLISDVRVLCEKLGLVSERATAAGPGPPVIVHAVNDPVYKEFLRLG